MTSFHINGVKLPTNINDMPEEIALKGDPIIMTENGRDMAMDMILNDSQLVGNLSYYVDSGEITSVSVDSISNNAEVEVYGISMGDSPEKVIEILGEPDEKNEDNIGMYLYMEDDMSTLMITFIDKSNKAVIENNKKIQEILTKQGFSKEIAANLNISDLSIKYLSLYKE